MNVLNFHNDHQMAQEGRVSPVTVRSEIQSCTYLQQGSQDQHYEAFSLVQQPKASSCSL